MKKQLTESDLLALLEKVRGMTEGPHKYTYEGIVALKNSAEALISQALFGVRAKEWIIDAQGQVDWSLVARAHTLLSTPADAAAEQEGE